MRSRRILLVAMALLLVASPASARRARRHAAPPVTDDEDAEDDGGGSLDDEDGGDAGQAGPRWRKQGVKAIPELVDELCKRRSSWRRQSDAREVLLDLGLDAVAPLLRLQADRRSLALDARICDFAPSRAAAVILRRALTENGKQARRSFDLVVTGLRSRNEAEAHAALDVLAWLAPGDDDESGSDGDGGPSRGGELTALLDAATPALLELGRGPKRSMQRAALDLLQRMPERAIPLLPDLGRMLESSVLRSQALPLLEAMGPDAAPALPALRAALGTAADIDTRNRIVHVLRSMGTAAAAALPALWDRLRDEHDRSCFTSAFEVEALASAILVINPAPRAGDARELAVRLGSALRLVRSCDGQSSEALAGLLRRMPASASSPVLLETMRDEDAELFARRQAAATLEGLGVQLAAADGRLQQALLRRVRQPSGPRSSARGASRLAGVLEGCRAESGVSGSLPALPPPPPRPQADRSGAAADCLEAHACGPDPQQYRRTLELCCRYAFGAAQPPWCADAAK